jgi:hypothetical protein
MLHIFARYAGTAISAALFCIALAVAFVLAAA